MLVQHNLWSLHLHWLAWNLRLGLALPRLPKDRLHLLRLTMVPNYERFSGPCLLATFSEFRESITPYRCERGVQSGGFSRDEFTERCNRYQVQLQYSGCCERGRPCWRDGPSRWVGAVSRGAISTNCGWGHPCGRLHVRSREISPNGPTRCSKWGRHCCTESSSRLGWGRQSCAGSQSCEWGCRSLGRVGCGGCVGCGSTTTRGSTKGLCRRNYKVAVVRRKSAAVRATAAPFPRRARRSLEDNPRSI